VPLFAWIHSRIRLRTSVVQVLCRPELVSLSRTLSQKISFAERPADRKTVIGPMRAKSRKPAIGRPEHAAALKHQRTFLPKSKPGYRKGPKSRQYR